MPKKFGQNTKAVEAKARKEEVKKSTNEKIRKEKVTLLPAVTGQYGNLVVLIILFDQEDAYWADDDPRIAKQVCFFPSINSYRRESLRTYNDVHV